MHVGFVRSHWSFPAALGRAGVATCSAALVLALTLTAEAQEAAQSVGAQKPAATPAAEATPASATQPATMPATSGAPDTPQVAPAAQKTGVGETLRTGGITQDELKQLLVGKQLYLRGGYLDNSLSFDEHGRLIGRSPQGSYTLSAIQINKVSLSKHKVELEGIRYGLHFVGQLAYEDPAKSLDRVRITPKKKVVKITIDREIVVKPKKDKTGKHAASAVGTQAEPQAQLGPLQAAEPEELSEADQLQSSIAAAPENERPADAKSVTTTFYPAHAAKVMKDALDQIFAQDLDERMMAGMPDFWRLYYEAVAKKADYRPRDPAVLRQNTVDEKARLLTKFEPDSNEFAQANGVAGMALYHTVVGPDGKAQEIAVGRPIGFGLDENAVEAIRKASFQPAIKDGKPVPVLLDLVVQFRIFSKRTAVVSATEPAGKAAEAALPGPYSVPQP
jgi:TonB family protein